MKSKASIGNHPLHPMLVAMPIGLWVFSFAADVIYLVWGNPNWRLIATYSLAGGCIGALVAALPGIIDYFFITDKKAKIVATWHMAINLCVVLLYSVDFFIRLDRDLESAGLPFVLSVLGVTLLSVSGWLGGELVYRHKMGVVEEEPNTVSRLTSHMAGRRLS
jgi:uncharacterized membrane protein